MYKSEFYDNGDSYMGYMLNGLKHGRGVYLFGNNSQYKGNWYNGVMHGWGVFIEQDTGDRFEVCVVGRESAAMIASTARVRRFQRVLVLI